MSYTYQDFIELTKEHPEKYCLKTHQAVSRFENMLKLSSKKNTPFYFDDTEVNEVIAMAEELTIIFKDNPQNMVIYPWQAFFFTLLYGWCRKDNDELMTQKAFLFTAKKNGKSVAEIVPILYDFAKRPNPRIAICATQQDQALNIFTPLSIAIESHPFYSKKFEVSHRNKKIIKSDGYGVIEALTKGESGKQGKPITLAVFDEYYLFKNDELISMLQYGKRSSKSPLIILVSTAGFSINSVCKQEYDRASKILNPPTKDWIDYTYQPLIFEYDDEDDWRDEKKLSKSNPMLGYTLDYENDFKSDLVEAKQKPSKAEMYKAYTCNVWASWSGSWIKTAEWKAKCINEKIDIEKQIEKEHLDLYAGLDLSKCNDITALSFYAKSKELNKYLAFHRFYIPTNTIEERMKNENPLIAHYIEKGFIIATDGDRVDYDRIIKDIEEINKKHKVKVIAYDPAMSEYIINNEYLTIPTTPVPINKANFFPATHSWYNSLSNIIDNNPVMEWMISTSKIHTDAGGRYTPMKTNYETSSDRNDGIFSSILAFKALKDNENNNEPTAEQTLRAFFNLNI